MKAFFKFNEQGKCVEYCTDADDIKDIRPNSEGFVFYEFSGSQADIPYLCLENGIPKIDASAKEADRLKAENLRLRDKLKTELSKVKEDIEQEVFGLVRNDFSQKKARAAEIVNELRVLEGKEPREVK